MDAPPAAHEPDILELASDAGRLVLESGGETYRAEDTVEGLLRGLGAASEDCFATPTGTFTSCTQADGIKRSMIRRVKRRGVDLGSLADLHGLRLDVEAGRQDAASAKARIEGISAARGTRPWASILGAAIVAAFFAPLFDGGWRELAVAAPTGALLKLVFNAVTRRHKLSDFFVNAVCGALIPPCAALGALAFPGLVKDAVTVAALMILVPGMAIVNAIRDLMAGDLVAGTARAADAFLAAAAIALGVGAGLLIPWPGVA